MNTAIAATRHGVQASWAVSRQRSPAATAGLTLGIEAVAVRADRDDRCGAASRPELASDIGDVYLHDVGPRVVPVSPNRAEDLLASQHVTSVAHQVREQLELGRREMDEVPALADLYLVIRSTSRPPAASVVRDAIEAIRSCTRIRAASSDNENGLTM